MPSFFTPKHLTIWSAFLLGGTLQATDFYVRPALIAGAHTGTDWNNAWNGFAEIKWGGVGGIGPGDTCWLAGGAYGAPLLIGGGGSPGSPITLKRARASDAAPAKAAGWSAGFDSPVIVSTAGSCIYFNAGVGSFVTIDGQTPGGIVVQYRDGGRGVEIDGGADFSDILLRYIEAAGPGPIVQSGDTRGFDLTTEANLTNLTVSHCSAHNSDTLLQVSASVNLLIEYCDLYSAAAINASVYHPNTIYLGVATHATVRYNTLHEISVEGLFFGDPGNSDVQIYGNLFYQGASVPESGRGIEFDNAATSIGVLVYNNTFVGLPLPGVSFGNGQAHPGATVLNNLFFKCGANFGPAAHDYNWTSGPDAGEAHGIANGADPFVNAAAYDYRIVNLIGPGLPRDKALNLGPPYNFDLAGNDRGADGAWDMGALNAPLLIAASVSLGRLSATYDGTAQPVAVTTIPGGFAVQVTYNGSTTVPSAVGSYAVVAQSADSGFTGSASGTLVIAKGTAQVTLGPLHSIYSGSPQAVAVVTTPAGLPVQVTYEGGSAPTAVGSYGVSAVVISDSYQGSASGTLVIGQAPQSLVFSAPAGVGVGTPIALAAVATSGLPVAYTLVSGNASLTGSVVTALDTGPITIRSDQSGDGDYLAAAPVTVIFSAATKLSQSVTLTQVSQVAVDHGPINLAASSSSNLPVTLAVTSGPAILKGNQLILTGEVGIVEITATQAGDATYAGAVPATMSFGVVPDGLIYAYFGSISGASTLSQAGIGPKVAFNGSLAATVDATLTFGTLVGTLPGSGFVLPVAFAADGSFSGSVSVLTSPGSPAGGMLNFSGVLAGRILTGSISGVASGSFAAVVDPAAGSSTGIAGFYSGPALGSASGSTYLVVGTQGDLLALAVAPTLVTGALGSVGVNNTFVVTLPGPATISGTVNPATTVVTSTLTTTSGTTVFASLAERTLPTGRLSNLSSLGTVSAANNLAAGFVIGGSGQASLLLRGIGPGLNPFGITDFLTQPQLQLYDGAGQVLAANSSWGGTAAMAAAFSLAGAFPLAADSLDAAVLKGLAAGSYTIQLGGAGAAVAGTALAEIYDAGGMPPADGPSLINLSARALVTPGSGGLTGGFVIAGNSPLKLLIRGVGPELSVFGVSAPLPDPALMVFDRSGSVVARNDDWATPIAVDGMQVPATAADLVSAAAATGAFPLAPGSKDAAVIVTLAPGLYSAQVTGGPASGVALVEIYAISP